jgi:carboxymethylenebutenolidase
MSETLVSVSPEGVAGSITDPAGLAAESVRFAGSGSDMVHGYLARPAAVGELPAMIVIHEAGGLNEHIRDVAGRIAQLGYVTLAVDLYTREGGPPPMDDLQAMMSRLFSIPDQRVVEDLTGAAEYLRAREDVSGKVGCIGFCMGGRYTLLFACSTDALDAAVDCWGGFIDRSTPDEISTPTRPRPPLDMAQRLSCPLLAAVGAEDVNPSPALGEQLRERASESGQPVRVDIYDGAGHAFFADYRPTYRPEPAAALWSTVVPFLSRHLHED